MALSTFHPACAGWFCDTLGEPTDVQARAWPLIQQGRHALIAAPTGSGKTLAAFFSIIDELVKRRLEGPLPDELHVLYISPLKALSVDVEKNLRIPLSGIEERLRESDAHPGEIRVQVRTGDTPASQRTAMTKRPPHILATTPESLYLLLTSDGGRKMLKSVHTVIVDEIHAVVGTKRGSHLALSLERLEHLAGRPLVRIGLSATQKPIAEVAKFLVGAGTAGGAEGTAIIDAGHRRALDLALEMPRSPLTAVMPNEVWNEVYDRLVELIESHRTTLVFVNTRRIAERMAHNLTQRLGADAITAHHGSMSKEHRLDAEERLKAGRLRALVATASLELGIDIGAVDLVCQMGSPRTIAAFLQRVGRSGHTVEGTPKGRLFPMSRVDLLECVAIIDSVKRGELDRIHIPGKPLEVLAQQIVAELSCEEYGEDELFAMVKRAYPYRDLDRRDFDEIMAMLADGFTTRMGRRRAYVHRDRIHGRARGRRSARLTALVSGGVIPDNFDYDVILEPQGAFIGTLNEDFAIESMAGDVVQLGNRSWRILGISGGQVRVEDAGDLVPGMPFWFGEGRGRSDELSHSVSRLTDTIAARFDDGADAPAVSAWLSADLGIDAVAAEQLVDYLSLGRAALGRLPSENAVVMERFFDEVGDMHLVIHAPFGSRLNRAWGLALRKCFCRKFNFELQAAATEDAILLSLGPTHSFPLEEVFDYLSPASVRTLLTQALLDAPMFKVRWRWNASTALAVIRRRAGKRVPPQFQRMQAEDLLALVFPDQLACPENLAPGNLEIPDHPLVRQTIDDCLREAMDVDGLEAVLARVRSGEIECIARDLREPSPLSEDVINARPYSFLDDAPLEERRVQAVRNRRWLDAAEAEELGVLDAAAIASVREEAWPVVRDRDELHDALMLGAFVTTDEGEHGDGTASWQPFFDELVASGRATTIRPVGGDHTLWVAAERTAQLRAALPGAVMSPAIHLPADLPGVDAGDDALREVVRSRLEMLGPVRAQDVADTVGLPVADIDAVLRALEVEGFVVQGRFTPGTAETEWCERRLLARIHRTTIARLRREIEPVSAADYMRFLFAWHGLGLEREGPDFVRVALEQMEGYEAPAAAWEGDILPSRVRDYDPSWLDALCLSGRVVWGRFRVSPRGDAKPSASPIRSTPLSLVSREHLDMWRHLAEVPGTVALSAQARQVLDVLVTRGALFFEEVVRQTGMLAVQAENALAELVGAGFVTSDGFSGLRSLLVDAKYRTRRGQAHARVAYTMQSGGRWSLLRAPEAATASLPDVEVENCARILLRRYGVVFRRLADRESLAPPWRDLAKTLRRMEARGEVRGGRFVDGVWGEQFALPEAVAELRGVRRRAPGGEMVSVSAADPVNLTGILTPGDRIGGLYGNRILYRDGVPIAVKDGGEVRILAPTAPEERWAVEKALVTRTITPGLRPYLGKGVRG